jgi:hypothetical protein
VPLFDQLSEKALSDFVLGYLIPELIFDKFITDKEDSGHPASTHLPNTQGLLTRIGTQGTTPYRHRKLKEGSAMTRATIQKILEDHDIFSRRR